MYLLVDALSLGAALAELVVTRLTWSLRGTPAQAKYTVHACFRWFSHVNVTSATKDPVLFWLYRAFEKAHRTSLVRTC